MSETDYPQMERQGAIYFNDYTTYKCVNCGRYASVPEDHAAPVACPWRCGDDG